MFPHPNIPHSFISLHPSEEENRKQKPQQKLQVKTDLNNRFNNKSSSIIKVGLFPYTLRCGGNRYIRFLINCKYIDFSWFVNFPDYVHYKGRSSAFRVITQFIDFRTDKTRLCSSHAVRNYICSKVSAPRELLVNTTRTKLTRDHCKPIRFSVSLYYVFLLMLP